MLVLIFFCLLVYNHQNRQAFVKAHLQLSFVKAHIKLSRFKRMTVYYG